MSEPITWRSISAPNFGASAALLNSGSDTMNQGITSLATLANGIADKQKGIEVSNAVAALGKAATDSERGAIFDANAASLGARGIDLKDLITADQAKHLSLNADATLAAHQAMNDSNIRTNDSSIQNDVIKRIGYGFDNQTAEGKLKNLVLEQQDAHNQSAASIRSSDASANSSNASAANSNDAISERKLNREERQSTKDTANAVYGAFTDPNNITKDANGKPILDVNGNPTVDVGMAVTGLRKLGKSIDEINAGIANYDTTLRRPEIVAANALVAKKAEDRNLAKFTQDLKNEGELRTASKVADQAAAAAGSHGYTSAGYDAGVAAAIDTAYATQVTMPDGKIIRLDPIEISALRASNSQTAVYGANSSGELQTDSFLKAVKSAMSVKVDAETNLRAAAKRK
jgi:hypothetical protein